MTISSLSLPRLSRRALPMIDNRILIVIVVIVVVGTIGLIGLVTYITVRLKKRSPHEPYEGTLVHPEDLAAQITPFGGRGPDRGRNVPRFTHTPGEDMRIALRRPDGSWHIADSLTPFEPAGVKDIDVLPSPSTTASECSFNVSLKEWEVKKVGYDEGYGFSSTHITLPPPAYSGPGHSDGNQSSFMT